MDPILNEVLKHCNRLLKTTAQLPEPMAISLATADKNARPTVRTVLLKRIDEHGITFFTNLGSRKGKQLQENPYAAICVYFQSANEQLQADGRVEPISDNESDSYWNTRPRASQIAAWASRQSAPMRNRQLLLDRIKKYENQFAGIEVARPDFWGGHRLIPSTYELWKGHADRLHYRTCYEKNASGSWGKSYKYP